MKKIVAITLLLMVSCVSVSYSQTISEIILKGGLLASPYLNLSEHDTRDVDLGFTLGAEAYLMAKEWLGIGLGVNHLFDTDIENTARKISDTNFYLSIKPKILIEDSEIDSIYFLVQAGLSNANIKIIDGDCSTGIYAGAGIGIESKWFIFEALYSYNNWAITKSSSFTRAYLYSLNINVGYKFKI